MRKAFTEILKSVLAVALGLLLLTGCGGGGKGGKSTPAVRGASTGTLKLRLPAPKRSATGREPAKVPESTTAFNIEIEDFGGGAAITAEFDMPQEPTDYVDVSIPNIPVGNRAVYVYAEDADDEVLAAAMEPVEIKDGEYSELYMELGMIIREGDLVPPSITLDSGEALRIQSVDRTHRSVKITGLCDSAALRGNGMQRCVAVNSGTFPINVDGQDQGTLTVLSDQVTAQSPALFVDVGRGPAPLAVKAKFITQEGGGTPSSVDWTFGDGDVESNDTTLSAFHVYSEPGIYEASVSFGDTTRRFRVYVEEPAGNTLEGLYKGIFFALYDQDYESGVMRCDVIADHGGYCDFISHRLSEPDSGFFSRDVSLTMSDGLLSMPENEYIKGGYNSSYSIFGFVDQTPDSQHIEIFGRPAFNLTSIAGSYNSVAFDTDSGRPSVCLDDITTTSSQMTLTGTCYDANGQSSATEVIEYSLSPDGTMTISENPDSRCKVISNGDLVLCANVNGSYFNNNVMVRRGSSYSQSMLTGTFRMIELGGFAADINKSCTRECSLTQGVGECQEECLDSESGEFIHDTIEMNMTLNSNGIITDSGSPDLTCYLSPQGDIFACGIVNQEDNFLAYNIGIKTSSTAAPPSSPTITTVSPASGYNNVGTTIVITGTNFQSGASVYIGETPCSPVTVTSSTQISCLVPAEMAPGAYTVTVANPNQQSGSKAQGFTVVPYSPAGETLSGEYYYAGLGMNGPGDFADFGTLTFSGSTGEIQYVSGESATPVTETFEYQYLSEQGLVMIVPMTGERLASISSQTEMLGIISPDQRIILLMAVDVDENYSNLIFIKKGSSYTSSELPQAGETYYCTTMGFNNGVPESGFSEMTFGADSIAFNYIYGTIPQGNLTATGTVPLYTFDSNGNWASGYNHAAVMEGGGVLLMATTANGGDPDAFDHEMDFCVKKGPVYPANLSGAYWGGYSHVDSDTGNIIGLTVIQFQGTDVAVTDYPGNFDVMEDVISRSFSNVTLDSEGKFSLFSGNNSAVMDGNDVVIGVETGADDLGFRIMVRTPEAIHFPIATITSPQDEAAFEQGTPITFTGTAMDSVDGDISSTALWYSDVYGTIGTGGSVTFADLPVGTHEITFTAENSDGMPGGDTITIYIYAPGSGDVLSGVYQYGGIESDGMSGGSAFGTATFIGSQVTFEYYMADDSTPTTSTYTYVYDAALGTFEFADQTNGYKGYVSADGKMITFSDISGVTMETGVLLKRGSSYTGSELADGDQIYCGSIGFRDGTGVATFEVDTVSGGTITSSQVYGTFSDGDLTASDSMAVPVFDSNGVYTDGYLRIAMMEGGGAMLSANTYINGGTGYNFGLCLKKSSTPYTQEISGLYVGAGYYQDSTMVESSIESMTFSPGGSFVSYIYGPEQGDWDFFEIPTFTLNSDGTFGEYSMSGAMMDGGGAALLVTHGQDELGFDVIFPASDAISAPTVAITAPADGAAFNSGDTITFTGIATDAQDGDVSSGLFWYVYDLDLALGTGPMVDVSDLPVGEHEILVSVSDTDNIVNFAYIYVTVNPPLAIEPWSLLFASGPDPSVGTAVVVAMDPTTGARTALYTDDTYTLKSTWAMFPNSDGNLYMLGDYDGSTIFNLLNTQNGTYGTDSVISGFMSFLSEALLAGQTENIQDMVMGPGGNIFFTDVGLDPLDSGLAPSNLYSISPDGTVNLVLSYTTIGKGADLDVDFTTGDVYILDEEGYSGSPTTGGYSVYRVNSTGTPEGVLPDTLFSSGTKGMIRAETNLIFIWDNFTLYTFTASGTLVSAFNPQTALGSPNAQVITRAALTEAIILHVVDAVDYTRRVLIVDPISDPSGTIVYSYAIDPTDNFNSLDMIIYNPPSLNNHPAVAVASDITSAPAGQPVSLDGSGSYDPDWNTIIPTWTQLTGPETVTLSDENSFTPAFTPSTAGTYTFSLVLCDGYVDSDPLTVTVTVAAPRIN